MACSLRNGSFGVLEGDVMLMETPTHHVPNPTRYLDVLVACYNFMMILFSVLMGLGKRIMEYGIRMLVKL